MKSSVWNIFGWLFLAANICYLAVFLSGCEYVTEEEADKLSTPTPGEDMGEATDSGRKTPRSSSKTVRMTRGVTTLPVAAGNAVGEVGNVFTVQFQIFPVTPIPPAPTGPHGTYLPCPTITYAIIKWSVDGNDVQRIVSVANGVSIAGVGEGATIQLYDASQSQLSSSLPFPPPVLAKDGFQYDVTVTVAPGTRGSTVNPPTFYPSLFDQITNYSGSGQLTANGGSNSSVVLDVPTNIGATSLFVLVGNGLVKTTPPEVIVYQNNASGELSGYDPTVYTDFVPLSPFVSTLQITNVDSANPVNYQLVYGIDG